MVENSVIDGLVLNALDMIEYATEVVDDTRNFLKMNEKKISMNAFDKFEERLNFIELELKFSGDYFDLTDDRDMVKKKKIQVFGLNDMTEAELDNVINVHKKICSECLKLIDDVQAYLEKNNK
jgi:hypothetical protein